MKRKWTDEQRKYMWLFSWTPRTADQILTMNYCIAWCKAYGKTMQDWMDSGFNNHIYSPSGDARKQKLLKLQMEMAV